MPDRINGAIPIDISLVPLVGEELLSVVLGKNHIELVFEHMCVNVTGGYEVLRSGNLLVATDRESLRSGAALLAELVGRNLASAEWMFEKGLKLRWTDDSEFIATIDGSGYESFFFSVPGEPGIVVV